MRPGYPTGMIAPHASCSLAVLVFETRRATPLLVTATFGFWGWVAWSRHGDDHGPEILFRFEVVGGIDDVVERVGAVHDRSQVPAREQLVGQSHVRPSAGGQRQLDAVVPDPAGRDDQWQVSARGPGR
jgi:hypothetical protein